MTAKPSRTIFSNLSETFRCIFEIGSRLHENRYKSIQIELAQVPQVHPRAYHVATSFPSRLSRLDSRHDIPVALWFMVRIILLVRELTWCRADIEMSALMATQAQ